MNTTPDQPAVRMSGLRLERGGRVVLRDIDLAVPRGSVTAVLGPSGSGKSTLLAALTGELRAGRRPRSKCSAKKCRVRSKALLTMRKRVGVLLQGNGLLTDLTAAENVALPLRTHTDLPDAGDPPPGRDEVACGRACAPRPTCSRANSPAAWRAASRWPARSRSIRR